MPISNKPHISLFSLCLAVAIGIASCQVIPENEQLIPVETLETERTSLLIDFSAVSCVNCPKASEEAHILLSQYQDQLVVIEAHPATNPLTYSPIYDYTCPAADSLYIACGGNSTSPLPTGVINMRKQSDGNYMTPFLSWGAAIYSANNDTTIIPIAIDLTFSEKQEILLSIRNLNESTLHATAYMWLTEDSIVGAQLMPDNSVNMEYVRNHLLRDNILPNSGKTLTIEPHDRQTITIPYTLPEKVVADHCHIVAAIMANGEVIQAAQKKWNNY